MFKWFVGAVLLVSLMICGAADFLARQKLEQRQQEIARKRIELQPLSAIDREVLAYQTQKDQLQRRIDLINQLKLNQRTASGAVAAIAALGAKAAPIDSIAIVDRRTIVINGNPAAADQLKRVASDYSVVFRGVTR